MRTRARTSAFACLLVFAACSTSQFIDRVVLVNDTGYPAQVEVRGEDGGWLGLATLSPHSIKEVDVVLDQGEGWTFRFSYGSYQPMEHSVSKEDLIDSGWKVAVPTEFEERLLEQGAADPP